MKKVKNISVIFLLVLFMCGILYIGYNSLTLISNNVKSKNYSKAYGFEIIKNTYVYNVGVDRYECKINTFKVGKVDTETTIKYDRNNHEKCIVVQKDHKFLNIGTIVTFIIGIGLLILLKKGKK